MYSNSIIYNIISGNSGHTFTNVAQGQHNIIVTCARMDNLSITASSNVSGLQFLNVSLSLETSGTIITIVPSINIGATHKCKLDDGSFVDCKPWGCKSTVANHFVCRLFRLSVSRCVRR